MKNVTTPILIQQSIEDSKSNSIQQQPQILRALILRHVESACRKFDVSIEDVRSQGKSVSEIEECMMSYFKFPNATYITETLFQELEGGFERSIELINSKKTNANLAEQYSFFFLLRILTVNFQALNFCSVSLPDLMEEDSYD
jgi:hypothetical protein